MHRAPHGSSALKQAHRRCTCARWAAAYQSWLVSSDDMWQPSCRLEDFDNILHACSIAAPHAAHIWRVFCCMRTDQARLHLCGLHAATWSHGSMHAQVPAAASSGRMHRSASTEPATLSLSPASEWLSHGDMRTCQHLQRHSHGAPVHSERGLISHTSQALPGYKIPQADADPGRK